MQKGKKIVIGIIIVIAILIIIGVLWFNSVIISKSEVKRIIINDMNIEETDVHFDDIDLELDEGYYSVELYYNNKEYNYKINCQTGAIIHTDFKSDTTDNVPTNEDNNYLSLKELETIALNYVGANKDNVTFIKEEKDYDNGELIYDIEFIYNKYEYEFEISAIDGRIIEYSKELNK